MDLPVWLQPGSITLQCPRPEGGWEDRPGWCSVDGYGNITLSFISEEDQRIIDAVGGVWR